MKCKGVYLICLSQVIFRRIQKRNADKQNMLISTVMMVKKEKK